MILYENIINILFKISIRSQKYIIDRKLLTIVTELLNEEISFGRVVVNTLKFHKTINLLNCVTLLIFLESILLVQSLY